MLAISIDLSNNIIIFPIQHHQLRNNKHQKEHFPYQLNSQLKIIWPFFKQGVIYKDKIKCQGLLITRNIIKYYTYLIKSIRFLTVSSGENLASKIIFDLNLNFIIVSSQTGCYINLSYSYFLLEVKLSLDKFLVVKIFTNTYAIFFIKSIYSPVLTAFTS